MVDQPSGPTWGAPPPPPPPRHAPPAGAWPATVPQPFRSLRGLAVAMTVLLVIDAVVTAVLVPLALHERQVVHDATSFGVLFVADDVREAVAAVNGVAGSTSCCSSSIAVLWMIWMWRAATNTSLLRRSSPASRTASRSAAGSSRSRSGSSRACTCTTSTRDPGRRPGPGERAAGLGPARLWWVLFVIGWAGSGFGQVTLKRGHRYDASSFDVRNPIFVVALLATVAAAVLAIVVVRSITRAQHDAWDVMAHGGAPGPYATAPAPAPATASWSPPPGPAAAVADRDLAAGTVAPRTTARRLNRAISGVSLLGLLT